VENIFIFKKLFLSNEEEISIEFLIEFILAHLISYRHTQNYFGDLQVKNNLLN
jgi:hypothetical protein